MCARKRSSCTLLRVIALWVALGSLGSFPPFRSSTALISAIGLAMSMVWTARGAAPEHMELRCECCEHFSVIVLLCCQWPSNAARQLATLMAPLGECYSDLPSMRLSCSGDSAKCIMRMVGLLLLNPWGSTAVFLCLGHGEYIVECELAAGATVWIVN